MVRDCCSCVCIPGGGAAAAAWGFLYGTTSPWGETPRIAGARPRLRLVAFGPSNRSSGSISQTIVLQMCGPNSMTPLVFVIRLRHSQAGTFNSLIVTST